jgi:hypothetical protein
MRDRDSQFASPQPEKYTTANGVGARPSDLVLCAQKQMADQDLTTVPVGHFQVKDS